MINPVSGIAKDLWHIIIVSVIILIIWIVNIIRYRQNGLLLFIIVIGSSVLIFFALSYWLINDTNHLFYFLLYSNLAIVILSKKLIPAANTKVLAAGVAVLVFFSGIYILLLKDNLNLYLKFRLPDENQTIRLDKWASSYIGKTDWKKVFQNFPDDEKLIRAAVNEYLKSVNPGNLDVKSRRIKKNLSFRDAAFDAWANYTVKHQSQLMIDPEISASLDSGFVLWWYDISRNNTGHRENLMWYLKTVHGYIANEFTDPELFKNIGDALQQSQRSFFNDRELSGILKMIITEIDTKIKKSEEAYE